MAEPPLLTVTVTQGPPGSARVAWQLTHGSVQAMGLARTLQQALRDVAELLGDAS